VTDIDRYTWENTPPYTGDNTGIHRRIHWQKLAHTGEYIRIHCRMHRIYNGKATYVLWNAQAITNMELILARTSTSIKTCPAR